MFHCTVPLSVLVTDRLLDCAMLLLSFLLFVPGLETLLAIFLMRRHIKASHIVLKEYASLSAI